MFKRAVTASFQVQLSGQCAKMSIMCLARRAFAFTDYLGVYAGKCTGRHLCVTFLSDVPATAENRVKKYSHDSRNIPGEFVCHHLPHRSVLKIQGQDTCSFLQGIVTNDMRMLLLEEPALRAMYSHVLNVQGRTLYDIMLYSLKEADAEPGVFLECDAAVEDSILRHMKVYKLRRKVSINPRPELSVWAVLPTQKNPGQEVSKPELSSPEKAQVWEADPRIKEMGWRLVMDSHMDPSVIIASCQKGGTEDYHRHRYAIGLPEGVKDLPPGVALPLESNIVYMQGISFSKGCYIGQELTARTHHTGVIRKRLMPVYFSSPVHDLEDGAALQTQAGKPAGKYRAGVGDLGLSLIRMAHSKDVLTVKSSKDTTVTLEVSVPDWWPKETGK